MSVDACSSHRPYLAALADGETNLVPAETVEHARDCPDCSREVAAHSLLGNRLRAAAQAAEPRRAAGAWAGVGGWRLFPIAVAAAVAVAIAGVELSSRAAPDPVLASAVLVANRQPEYQSNDAADLARWCTAKYGNRVPQVAISGLVPEGARMDWPGGTGIATVTYVLNGHAVHVSWVSKPEGASQPQIVQVSGQPAAVVRAHGISAVVTGNAPESDLLRVAQEISTGE